MSKTSDAFSEARARHNAAERKGLHAINFDHLNCCEIFNGVHEFLFDTPQNVSVLTFHYASSGKVPSRVNNALVAAGGTDWCYQFLLPDAPERIVLTLFNLDVTDLPVTVWIETVDYELEQRPMLLFRGINTLTIDNKHGRRLNVIGIKPLDTKFVVALEAIYLDP
jgi:hypothetical protein